MKKFQSHLQFVLFLVFISTSNISYIAAQSIHVIPQGMNTGNYVYSLINIPNVNASTSAFWVLGDGHFRTGLTVQHSLWNSVNNVSAYLLDPYAISPPTRYFCNGNDCTSNGISMNTNPQVLMNSNDYLKVGTSWNPVPGKMHYTILTFQNAGTMEGTVNIQFDNNISLIVVDSSENNIDWATNIQVNNTDKELSFSFDNLQPGEQRHLLVQTHVEQNSSSNYLNYQISVTEGGSQIYENSGSSLVRRYPHDPNDKIVNIEQMCSYNLDPTTLEYTITFQNIGLDYANEVIIYDHFPPELDVSTIQILDSSDPYQFYILPNNKLEIVFNPIMLPGLNQTVPNIPHPDETIGFVKFSVETYNCLPPGMISNTASIVFDNLGQIETPDAITDINYFEDCNPTMDACQYSVGHGDDDVDGDPEIGGQHWNNEQRDYAKLEIYPNPVRESFNINLELGDLQSSNILLSVYNIHGILMKDLSKEILLGENSQKINVKTLNWPKGIYFVKLENTNEIHTWKIIKF